MRRRQWLISAILLAAVIGITATEIIVVHSDSRGEVGVIFGRLWVALPYLVAAGLAWLFRRHPAVLIVLLCALLTTSAVGLGVPCLREAFAELEAPRRAAGPSGGSNLEVGMFAWLLVLATVFCQLVVILISTLIAYAVVLRRLSREARAAGLGPNLQAGG